MPLVPMKQILEEANQKEYAVGAFNINFDLQGVAIFEAADAVKSPLIIQVSRNALKFALPELLCAEVKTLSEIFKDIPVALHLDHGPDLETIQEVIDLGFTSVMIDGSLNYAVKDPKGGHPPRTFEENIEITKKAVEMAHPRGVTVEGELGTLGGIEDGTEATEVHLTDPDQVVEFVEKTGVDALAIAIGTSHGAYKFKDEPKLALDIVEEVHKRVPEVALVMHGSSSVPKEMVDKVNKFGGQVPGACGVPTKMIQEAIKLGMRKVNIDTDGRLAVTAAIREFFATNPSVFDPRGYLKPARAALTGWVQEEMKAFGSAGHATDYKPMTLQEAKEKYYS